MSNDATSQTKTRRTLAAGDEVKIVGAHPWTGERGSLVAFEEYGLGWKGWRVALDNGTECYASNLQLRKVQYV